MQSYFNKHVFLLEQAEYEAEGIDWSYIDFKDNQQCVELIDGKPFGKTGIFQTLDDATSSGRQQDANANFLVTLNQLWASSTVSSARHPHYVAPRFNSDRRFGVLHYAGEVFYEIAGFSEKNRDSTNNDMKELLRQSGNALLKGIAEEAFTAEVASSVLRSMDSTPSSQHAVARKVSFSSSSPAAAAGVAGAVVGGGGIGAVANTPPVGGVGNSKSSGAGSGSTGLIKTQSFRSGAVSKLKEPSVSKQFTNSLRLLFDTLKTTQTHFVRCIKPNIYKRPGKFNAKEVLQQLKYSGMLETVRIRQQGYALRMYHKDCFYKYSRLAPECSTLQDLVDRLSQVLSVSSESWQVGTTKIFIRRDMSDKLDKLLYLRHATSARVLQVFWKGILRHRAALKLNSVARMSLQKRRFMHAKASALKLQAHYRGWKEAKRYRHVINSVANIQRIAMGRVARILARKLRSPYNRMTYEELTVRLRGAQSDLAVAFGEQNFLRCAELEANISEMMTVRNKLILPMVHPVARNELELHIHETSLALEWAMTTPEFAAGAAAGDSRRDELLGSLRERATRLKAMRQQLPTLQELETTQQHLQEDLAQEMETKNFRRCGELQQELTNLASLLESLRASAANPEQWSLATLKRRKQDYDRELAEALRVKDFAKCGESQDRLDEVEALLLQRDMTLDDAIAAKTQFNIEIASAREINDFYRIAELSEAIVAMDEVIAFSMEDEHLQSQCIPGASDVGVPAATGKIGGSRDAVATATTDEVVGDQCSPQNDDEQSKGSTEADVRPHLKGEEAKLASQQQNFRAEILDMIRQKEEQISYALKTKQYSLCAELNSELEVLSVNLDALPTAAKVGEELVNLESELRALIEEKQFAQCAKVEQEIQRVKGYT